MRWEEEVSVQRVEGQRLCGVSYLVICYLTTTWHCRRFSSTANGAICLLHLRYIVNILLTHFLSLQRGVVVVSLPLQAGQGGSDDDALSVETFFQKILCFCCQHLSISCRTPYYTLNFSLWVANTELLFLLCYRRRGIYISKTLRWYESPLKSFLASFVLFNETEWKS